MAGFQRVNPLGEGFIRGPARYLVEPITSPYPAKLGDIINLATSGYTTEVQTITITGTPAGGTFQLAFLSQVTSLLAYNATNTDVQTALRALPGIGSTGVTVTGGPGPGTPYVVTFAGPLASSAQPLITASGAGLTGGTTPSVTVTRTTPGFGLYDPVGGWTELGSSRGGCQISRNNTETQIDVDQILASIVSVPDEWEMTIATQLAETTLENIQIAWEGGVINLDITTSPDERHLGLGNPTAYVLRRLAVIHQKTIGPAAGKLRAHVFRQVSRSPVASTLDFQKTGNQSTLPLTFRAYADPAVGDPYYSMGEVIDQAIIG
jgi:hypothetical protein